MVLCRGSVTSADHVSTAALVQRLSWRVAPLCILCCRAAVCIRIPADQQSYNLSLFLWHRHLVYIMFQRRSLCPSYFSSLDLVTRCCYKYGACPYVGVPVSWLDRCFLCLLQIIKSVCRSKIIVTWPGVWWCFPWFALALMLPVMCCHMFLSCYEFGADISPSHGILSATFTIV